MKIERIIIIILIVILGGAGFWIFKLSNQNDNENNCKLETDKEAYYQNVFDNMYDYYKIMFKNTDYPENQEYSTVILSLGALEREGFPMDEFVSFDGKEECDRSMSFATRKVVNNKYKIEVYYKCGNTANYDYTNSDIKPLISSDSTGE